MKLIVIGGVAAGMSAAARARRLDESAQIIVLERGPHVSFANCGLPYHIGGKIQDRERLLVQTPQRLRAMLNLDVRVNSEVVHIDREAKKVLIRSTESGEKHEESYDKLVLTPGASPIRPPLPGIEDPRILSLRNLEDMDRIKAVVDKGAQSAVVIGGGFIGVEMAENLVDRGLNVTLIELADQIMPPLDPEMVRDLEDHMRQHGVKLRLGVAASGFKASDEGVSVTLQDDTILTADLVILSIGVRPDSKLAADAGLQLGSRGGIKVNEHLQTSDPDIYAAGDAIEVMDAATGAAVQIPMAGPANRQGRIVGDNVTGHSRACTTTKGTGIVKVFDMTAASTGAAEKTLKRLGVAYEKVYIHPSNHAGYYPDAAQMHIKLLFAPGDGRILGAQVIGYEGVDKRIDVFATAICGKMTVYDLEHLELAYAPPYGSAKDPVNMAGFVAANLLRGDLKQWYAEDFSAQTGLLVDVRTPEEFNTWHIPGAQNWPVTELRESVEKLPKDQPLHVYCGVGFRSYLAYRILTQSGREADSLAGGSLTYRAVYHEPVPTTPEPKQDEKHDKAEIEEQVMPEVTGSAKTIDLNLCGLQCPGPIQQLTTAIQKLAPGDIIAAVASDPGFAKDGPAWCRSRGHELLEVKVEGPRVMMRVRKHAESCAQHRATPAPSTKKTMVIFSGDLDKVLAGFIIANGAASMGDEVTMFFTFWGLNALRKNGPQASGKPFLDRMFGWMMPKGASQLTLSKMHMMGMGTAMMKHVMKSKNVASLPELIASAKKAGVKLVACTMAMDVMGLGREELIDGLEIGGVASFLEESNGAGTTLFI